MWRSESPRVLRDIQKATLLKLTDYDYDDDDDNDDNRGCETLWRHLTQEKSNVL